MEGMYIEDIGKSLKTIHRKIERFKKVYLAPVNNDLQLVKLSLRNELELKQILNPNGTLNEIKFKEIVREFLTHNYEPQATDKGKATVRDLMLSDITRVFLHYDIKLFEFKGLIKKDADMHAFLEGLLNALTPYYFTEGQRLVNVKPDSFMSIYVKNQHIPPEQKLDDFINMVKKTMFSRDPISSIIPILKTRLDYLSIFNSSTKTINEQALYYSVSQTLAKNYNGSINCKGNLDVKTFMEEPIVLALVLLHSELQSGILLNEVNNRAYTYIKNEVLKLIQYIDIDNVKSMIANVKRDSTSGSHEPAADCDVSDHATDQSASGAVIDLRGENVASAQNTGVAASSDHASEVLKRFSEQFPEHFNEKKRKYNSFFP